MKRIIVLGCLISAVLSGAELLGLHSEVVSYQNKAELSRAAIRRAMLRDGLFMDNPASRHTAIHSCIFPALWDIAEPAEKPRILALMKSKGMACSVFCAQFLLECCGVNRMMDYGLELMTSAGLRSWNNMLCWTKAQPSPWKRGMIPSSRIRIGITPGEPRPAISLCVISAE